MIIRVTPDELKNQSNQVLADIKEIEKHWKAITDRVNGTRHYWEGEASNTHMRIYKDVADDVNRLSRSLGENPVKLQMMAGVYDEAESAAQSTASELPTDVF